MSFDDDAEIPVADLTTQWDEPFQQVSSLISSGKRMSPDGELMAAFVKRGYPVDTHPLWFGTRRQHDENDATLGENDATVDENDVPLGENDATVDENDVPLGEHGDLDVMVDGKMVNTVFTTKIGYPIPSVTVIGTSRCIV